MFAAQPSANTNVQLLTVADYPSNRLACIRQLGHLSIYADSQTGRFLLTDDESNVRFVFNDFAQATGAALKAHYEAIDRQNHQCLMTHQ